MQQAESILVIILSVTLAIFLVSGIILFMKLIQLSDRLNEIALKANNVVDNVESVTHTFTKAAAPLAIGKFIANIADLVMKQRNKGGR